MPLHNSYGYSCPNPQMEPCLWISTNLYIKHIDIHILIYIEYIDIHLDSIKPHRYSFGYILKCTDIHVNFIRDYSYCFNEMQADST